MVIKNKLTFVLSIFFVFTFLLINVNMASATELDDSLTKIDTKTTLNPFGYKKIVYEPITTEKLIDESFMFKEESFDYPVVRISKSFLWVTTDKIAEYKLTNSGNSLINSFTEGKAILYEKGKLFDEARFIGSRGENKELNYNYFIKKDIEYFNEIPVYSKTEICEDIKTNETIKSTEKNCYFPVDHYDQESYFISEWVKYNYEILDAGEYEWKVEAERPINKKIDFIPVAQSIVLDEYIWWDNDWQYKKPINISTAQVTRNNYTVLLNIAYDSDMQTDFDDLRFTNGAETLELNYWLNNKTDSTSAYVWVNTSLTQNQNTTIYMYYGNGAVASASDRSKVFANYNSHGDPLTTGNAETRTEQKGLVILTTAPIIIDRITKDAGDGNRTKIVDGTLSGGIDGTLANPTNIYATAWTTGGIGNLTNPYVIANNTYIYLASDKGGASYTNRYGNSGTSYPFVRAGATWVTAVNWNNDAGSNVHSSWIWDILGFNFGYDPQATIYFGEEVSANYFEINLISPVDDYNSTSQSIDFECNATDETGVLSLNLTINGTVYETVTGAGSSNLTLSSTETLADGYWEWYCTGNDDQETKNSTTRSLLIDSQSPTLSTAYNLTDLITLTLPINSTWHFNATDTHISTCYYNTTDHAQTIVACNSTINTTWATEGTKEIYYCANDTFGLETCNSTSIDIYHITYDQDANPRTIAEGFNVTFNLTVNMTSIPTSSAYLVLNNTVYPATTSTPSANSYFFERTVEIPDNFGNATGIVQDWYWNYTIDGVITNQSTSTDNITVYELAIDDCSSYGDVILNFSLNDEETNILVNESAGANVEIDLTLTSKTNSAISLTYSNTWTNENNPQVCLPNNVLNNSQYWLDLVVGFSSTDHVWEFYYLDDGTLNSSKIIQDFNGDVTSNISLMDLLTADSTSFLFNYFDQDGLAVTDAIVHVMRQYIGSGQFLEVERGKADENGDTIVHLVEEDVIYFFYITQYGELIYTSSTYTALCQATPCRIQLEASGSGAVFPTDWDLIDGGAYSISSDPSTREVNLTYALNSTSTMNLTVFKYNSDGSYSPINSSTSTGTSGSILMTVPQSAGNVSFFATVYQDDEFKNSEWVDFEGKAQDRFGVTLALFIGALIILSLGLMAITEGVGTLVFVLLGVALSGFLGLVTTTLNTGVNIVVYLVVAGGILLWKLTGGRR